jgi:hypothetical protein
MPGDIFNYVIAKMDMRELKYFSNLKFKVGWIIV